MFILLELILVVIAVLALVRVNTLKSRVDMLEKRLQQPAQDTGVVDAVGASAEAPPVPQIQKVAPDMTRAQQNYMDATYTTTRTNEPGAFAHLVSWCKEDWLMKLGGLFIVMGMAWFVNYAIAEGWIGPYGRIGLGLVVGAGILSLGWYRLQRFVVQGSVVMFVGAAVVILTTFAARELYPYMFPPLVGLVVMFGTSCFLGLTSVLHTRRELAYANVVLAAVAPLMVNTNLTLVETFTYLLVLTLGVIWVAGITGWRVLPFASLVVVGLYSLDYVDSYYYRDSSELSTGLLFAFVFVALFFSVSVVGMRMLRKVSLVDLLLALGSGLFLVAWIIAGAEEGWQSLLLVMWTLVFAFGAFTAIRLGAGIAYFYSYAGVGVALLGIATAIELDGPTLAIAFIAEATLVLWLGHRITGKVRAIPVLMLPAMFPILLSFESMVDSNWRDAVFHEDALVLVLMAIVTYILGLHFYTERLRASEEDRPLLRSVATGTWIVSGLYGAVLVWLVAHALFDWDSGTMVALVVYALIAVLLYTLHSTSGLMWQRHVANILIAFVAGWLLLVEQWDMDPGPRAMTFLVIGAMIALIAWLERNRKKGATPPVEELPNTTN